MQFYLSKQKQLTESSFSIIIQELYYIFTNPHKPFYKNYKEIFIHNYWMKQIKFKQNFGRCYKQYVEYLNQVAFSKEFISFLFFFQSLQLSASLLPQISVQEPVKTLSLVGVHNFIGFVADSSSIIKSAIPFLALGGLCCSLIIPIHIAFESYNEQLIKNGTFKKIFQFSNTHKIFRYFFVTFQFTTLPISLLFLSKNTQIYITIIASFVIFIIAFTIDYHSLELIYHSQTKLVKVNFPNKLIDTTLLICTIIIMGSLNGISKFVASISCNFLRYILLCKLQVFTHSQQLQQKFYIAFNQTLAIGLFISYLVTQKNVGLMISFLLLWIEYTQKQRIKNILFYKKIEEFTSLLQQQLKQEQFDSNQCSAHIILASIQQQFQKRGNFAGLFRKLIFLGSKNISYRERLAITVLKSKCYQFQINSRGSSARIVDCQTVMKYQQLLKQIIGQFLQITNKSIQILKLIQKKEQYIYTFNQMVQSFHLITNHIKRSMVELMHINQWSFEGRAIINILFCNINKDYQFLQEIREIQKRSQTESSKKIKIELFNQKTVMVFVNMLDQIGKIVKTSKNLPTILGYNPHQLQGIDVDSILLPSMKVHHINNLTRFIDTYDKSLAMSQRTILFYMNNNNYQLQKVDVGYNLVMSSFHSFMVCGIIKKAYQNEETIILNSEGNIEGCSKKLGIQLGLNNILGPKMNRFNFLSLIPALIKYGYKNITIKTMIFKVNNMESNYCKEQGQSNEERGKYNNRLFMKLLEEDIVQGYYAFIKVKNYCFFNNKVPLQEIAIKSLSKITNFQNIRLKIISKFKANENLLQGSFLSSQSSCQIQEQEAKTIFDTNFSLQSNKSSIIKLKQLQFTDIIDEQNEQQFDNNEQYSNNNKQIVATVDQSRNRKDRSQKATIQKSWKLVYVLLIVIALLLGLVIANFVYLRNKAYQMEQINEIIIHANKALSITIKFVFDPYQQGLKSFQNNHLLNPHQQLASEYFSYTTSYNKTIAYSDFYFFNIHIPSLLNEILSTNTRSSQESKLQLLYNIDKIIQQSDRIFNLLLEIWYQENDDANKVFYINLILFLAGSVIFLCVGLFMNLAERKQLKSYQAFFKFRKQDLIETVQNINRNIKQLQQHSAKWYLDKEFDSYIKEGNLNNLQFEKINKTSNSKDPKIMFEQGNKRQQSLKSKLFYRFIGYFIILITSQTIYLIIFTIQTKSFLWSLRNTPTEVNNCSKLMITPQYLLATLRNDIQTQILKKYLQTTKECISSPMSTIPNLFHYISTQPCEDCTFLYPLLTTSYVSFYNSFQAMIFYNKQANQSQYTFQQMIKGASLVGENLYQQLQKWTIIYPSYLSPISYLVSILIILLLTLLNFKKLNQETNGVQCFLQLFDKEIIEKNKLLVNLLDKKE